MVENDDATRSDAPLEQVLDGAFAQVDRVHVVGTLGRTSLHGRFVAADGTASPSAAVLVVGENRADLERAVELARSASRFEVHVLVERHPDSQGGLLSPDALGRLHDAGLAVSGVERVLWATPGDVPAGSRLDRLDAETRAVLLHCVRADDAQAVLALEGAILALGRRLDIAAELQLEHARTRDVERERLLRLERLERLVDLNAVEEAERLRAELDELTSTRLVRLGERYWRARDRLLGRSR